MSKFLYKGYPVKVRNTQIEFVDDCKGGYEVRVFDPRHNWQRSYYLTKSLTRRAPKVGEILTSYEYFSEVVGCDFNGEAQFRAQGFKEI